MSQRVCVVIIFVLKDRISANVGHIVIYLVSLLPVLNAFINPLIYAVRITSLRVAFIQLLSRRTLAEAEELESKIFGPRQIGVTANVEQGQDRAGQQEKEQQGNETMNYGRVITVRALQQDEYEETPFYGHF